jgi:hypothetical protein
MKFFKIVGAWMAGAGLLLTAQLAFAGTLAGSKHDFSTQSWNPSQKVCVVCHAPHNSNLTISDAPLWNHTNSSLASYTLYSSVTTKAVIGQPGNTSKLCLSCHDGTVAIDSFGGTVGSVTIGTGYTGAKATTNMGSTLKDDHPIGFPYDTTLVTANGSLFDPTATTVTIGTSPTKTGKVSDLMLYSGKVECSSCHDVHNTFTVGTTGMLKMAAGGATHICAACHNK